MKADSHLMGIIPVMVGCLFLGATQPGAEISVALLERWIEGETVLAGDPEQP